MKTAKKGNTKKAAKRAMGPGPRQPGYISLQTVADACNKAVPKPKMDITTVHSWQQAGMLGRPLTKVDVANAVTIRRRRARGESMQSIRADLFHKGARRGRKAA